MTANATDGVNATFDAESRIATALKSGVTTTYVYDSDGNRVKKTNGNNDTLYWYMTPGIVAESDLSGATKSEYVFFNGERVARRDYPAGSVAYYFSDHLKTASVITDATGNIKAESDYYPWGGELQLVNNDSNHYKFTGKERDGETGLDYFGARYYSNGLGRWVSADWSASPTPVPYADFGDPQSLNLNTYVRNIPTTQIDPDGHCPPCLEEQIVELIIEHPREAAATIAAGAEKAGEALVKTAEVGGKAVANTVGVVLFVLTASQKTAGPDQDEPHLQPPAPTPQTQTPPDAQNAKDHKKGARPSTQEKHEEGQARKRRDRGGEKGDARRRPPRKRPPGWKGPWPPKPPKPPDKPPEQPPEKPDKDKT